MNNYKKFFADHQILILIDILIQIPNTISENHFSCPEDDQYHHQEPLR